MADENDDLLNPDEIEGLLNADETGSSDAGPSSGVSPDASEAVAKGGASESVSPQETSPTPTSQDDIRQPDVAEQLLNQAEADLQAALASDLDGASGGGDPVDQAAPYEFQEFDDSPSEDGTEFDVEAIKDVELDLCIELGRTELLIEEVLKLKEGSVVPLDKLAGDPVDIVVNGRLIARGEVLVLNDNFCVRVAEILSPEM